MNGYTLTLAAFLLIGGSLGDRFGRRKVYLIGTVWFAWLRRRAGSPRTWRLYPSSACTAVSMRLR
jgi:MFS family permease